MFGKGEKQQAHCNLLSDKSLRQKALAETKENIPGNKADNERAENSHITEIIPRGTCIRWLFSTGLSNCSTAGKGPAIAKPNCIFLG